MTRCPQSTTLGQTGVRAPWDQTPGLDLLAQRGRLYASRPRSDAIAFLDRPLGRVLDLGCGAGASASVLRSRGASYLAGVEIDPFFASKARERYDDVVTASVTDELPWAPDSFDTVLCYDILEHLYDPWTALRRVKSLARTGGRVHVSLPNARNKDLWLPLLARGRFSYSSAGVLDVTHLRFFARRDAVAMLEAAGLEVLAVDHAPPGSLKRRLAASLTGGHAMEFLAHQWYLLARPLQRGIASGEPGKAS